MPQPSVDAVRAPANGQIFALKKPLSKAAVEAAFEYATEKASGRRLGKTIRAKRTANGKDFWASFICFPLTRPVPFLIGTDLEERTYGFLLLLEVQTNGDWFVGIFNHAAASLADWLEARAKRLPRGKFTRAFTGKSAVRKMSLRRMTSSKHELHAATYEAPDLQASLPIMSASRTVIRSLRFQDSSIESIGITVNTSRVQRSGGRCPVSDLAILVRMVAERTQADKSDAFLGTFAEAIAIEELPADAEPTSILFDWGEIIETDILELRRKSPADGQPGRQISKRVLYRFLGDTLRLFSEDEDAWQFGRVATHPRGELRRSSSDYSVRTILGNHIYVHNVGTKATITLARWARENDAYKITFSQPEYCFTDGGLYRRANFTQEVDIVRRCLRVQPSLAAAVSEKGKPMPTDVRFPTESIFGICEDTIYADRTFFCCTDLGDEWADFLCIRGDSLLFLHCKGGEGTIGASAYQEVVGQGLKNLGRIHTTPAEFQAKLEATKTKRYWGSTRIERLRDADQKWPAFQAAVDTLLRDPNASREVHLVVSMLSRAQFEAAAAKSPTPYFIQLVWLLAGFINSCREMGAKPVIVCGT
jgi:hypothetical protein